MAPPVRLAEGMTWAVSMLPLCYYIALAAVLAVEKMWVPFGLAFGVSITCLLYLTAVALFVGLDRYIKRCLVARSKAALNTFFASKAASRHAAATDPGCIVASGATDTDEDRDLVADVTAAISDDDDDRDEDMLTSILSSHRSNVESSAMLSSIDRSQSSLSSHVTASASPVIARNPFRSPSGDCDCDETKAPQNGGRVVVAGKVSDTVFASSSSSFSSSLGHQLVHARPAFENKNTVKHNLGANSHSRGAWQSFASLLSERNDAGEKDSGSGRVIAAEHPTKQRTQRRRQTAHVDSSSGHGGHGNRSSRAPSETAQALAVLLAVEEAESARWVCRFTLQLLPRARMVITILHVLMLWIASFVVAYYTNVLFAVIPAFACPVLWLSMAPVEVLLRCESESRKRRAQLLRAEAEGGAAALMMSCVTPPSVIPAGIHWECRSVKLVRILMHWLASALVCLTTVLLYVAAITLPLVRQDELLYEAVKDYTSMATVAPFFPRRVATSVIAVCYLSPIAVATLVFTATMDGAPMRRTADRLQVDTRQGLNDVSATGGSIGGYGAGGALVLTPEAPATAADDFFIHQSDLDSPVAIAELLSRRNLATQGVAAPSGGAATDTTYTLSSILRSFTSGGQSHRLLRGTSVSVVTAPEYAGATHRAGSSAVYLSRPPSISSSTTQRHSPPQLKTVTLLYVAFRDIFDSDDIEGCAAGMAAAGVGMRAGAAAGSARNARVGNAAVGAASGAAARNKQLIMTTKFEALLQAVEDARSTGFSASDGGGVHGQPTPHKGRKGSKRRDKDMRASTTRNAHAGDGHCSDSDAYVLTAHQDAVVLVWGLLPFSSDPVKLAVEKARAIFAAFRRNPKPYAIYGNSGGSDASSARPELVAAVVYAPHSLVATVGSAYALNPFLSYRTVHFLNPDQHTIGTALLERGFQLHRKFHETIRPAAAAAAARNRSAAQPPSAGRQGGRGVETSVSVNSFSSHDLLRGDSASYYHGILLDSRAVHSAASRILARPCGVIGEETATRNAGYSFFDPLGLTRGGAVAAAAGSGYLNGAATLSVASGPRGTGASGRQGEGKSSTGKHKFTVLYDFVTFVSEREEEWHLVVQRNEKLSVQFRFLLDATQSLQQNSVRNAQSILQKGIQEEKRKAGASDEEPEVVGIANLFLDDIESIEASRRVQTEGMLATNPAEGGDFCI